MWAKEDSQGPREFLNYTRIVSCVIELLSMLANMRKAENLENQYMIIFPQTCANSWHLGVYENLRRFTPILGSFNANFICFNANIKCFAPILVVFIDLFGANSSCQKNALRLICALFSCHMRLKHASRERKVLW